jgi:hypothetical protein
MSITPCAMCSHFIDTEEEDFYTHPISLKSYCEACYEESPMHCEDRFDFNGDCICGEHRVLPSEEDVGINRSYLELK